MYILIPPGLLVGVGVVTWDLVMLMKVIWRAFGGTAGLISGSKRSY